MQWYTYDCLSVYIHYFAVHFINSDSESKAQIDYNFSETHITSHFTQINVIL